MSTSGYLENLDRLLALYIDRIERANSLALLNEATIAENFFCAFLNRAFGWNLVNTNEQQLNRAGIDLVDYNKGLSIQVTSNKNYAQKRKQTIAAFSKKADKRIKKVIILFAARKCPKPVLKAEKKFGISFEGYDLPVLMHKIYYTNTLPAQLAELNAIAESMIHPALVNGAFPIAGASFATGTLPFQKVTVKRDGLYINRAPLVKAVFSFAQVDHGLIIGGPGYGKSVILAELQEYCHKQGVPCFLIRINELIDGTDEEINRELNTAKPWVTALAEISFKKNAQKGTLIFDAFDTAKEEKLKQRVLKHIRTAQEKLSGAWHVLASVRTFEASHSTQLRDLFSQTDTAGKTVSRIFTIPELSAEELETILKKYPKLEPIVAANSSSLQKLLRIPYFLKLLENISDSIPVSRSAKKLAIETEDQLLELFWSKKVEQTADDLFLHKLTSELVTAENLSCPRLRIVNENNTAQFDRLVSSGVVAETSFNRQNISFSHNILLEYAVARFIIPVDEKEIVDFIKRHEKVAFLFRQSFIYFYSGLWKKDQPLFWKHYHAIRQSDTALFRLIHQTILNYVLCLYYRDMADLRPVLDITDKNVRGVALRKVLEAIRFISGGIPRDKDIHLLHEIAQHMHILCIWELGFLLNQFIEHYDKKKDHPSMRVLSKAAVKYLEFVLEERKTADDRFMAERNGGTWAIRNIIACFAYQKTAAAKLLVRVTDVLKEEDFPIYWFYPIADGLPVIAKNNGALAVKLYRTIYFHHEISNKETFLGGNVVLPLRSNRNQDFNSVHHQLESRYAELLKLDPGKMIVMGLAIVNAIDSQKPYYRKWNLPRPVLVDGVKSRIVPEVVFFDDDHDREYGPLSHIERIIKYLEALVVDQHIAKVKELLPVLFAKAEAGKIWRRLIRFLSLHAIEFRDISFSMLLNVPFYICNETTQESGDLITAIWPLLTAGQKKQLEKFVLSISDSVYTKDDPTLRRTGSYGCWAA